MNRNDAIRSRTMMNRIRIIKVQKRIHFRKENLSGGLHVGSFHKLGTEVRVRKDPRRSLHFIMATRAAGIIRASVVRGEKAESRRLNDGVSRVEKRLDGDPLVTARQRVSRMDIGVAGDAESSSISLASNGSWSLFTDLANPHTLVAGSQLIGTMNLRVAGEAEESRVGAAKDS